MGDFNSEPNDEPIKILEKFMIDGLKISLKSYKVTGTFNGFDVPVQWIGGLIIFLLNHLKFIPITTLMIGLKITSIFLIIFPC